nr:hypothetical protein [Tanacetum cinerariifolium]
SASDGTGKKKGRTVTLTIDDMQKRKNDVKARTTLLLSLLDEHQLQFSKYKTAQELWAAILKTFGGNEATKKTKKNLQKQQYGNFKAKGSETLEQTLAPEWLMHTIVWRNRSDLDTISLDDLYNHLKVYKSEVQKKSKPNSQNMAFISSVKHSSGNEEVNITSGSTASINVSTASTNIGVALSVKTLLVLTLLLNPVSYMANDEENHALIADEETPMEFALMANTSAKSETGLLEFKDDTVTDYSRPSPAIESTSDDAQNRNPSVTKTEASPITISPKPFIKFMKANDSLTKKCIVLGRDFKLLDDANVLLRTHRKQNMYSIDLNNIVPHKDLTCLVAKASAAEGMLCHRRLGHLNFKTMNRLVRHNLVRGLPSKYFENDHTCSACLKGKQHKASCKSKFVNSVTKPLHTLHMDLFGPTSVSSISHKWYCLVVTDDFSRFTWTFFLKTKDETSSIIRKFITEIENLKDLKVKIIRGDNGGEFRNKEMDDFCSQKGIKKEFSNPRTSYQNHVAERRNRTLIEAARTMLADAKLPFKAKGDEGYFFGYSMSSKAFRVFNKRTKRVEENLHVEFLENKAIEKGAGPNWLFDIDSLTKSMNYVSVVAGINSTNLSGIKEAASQKIKKDVSSLRYIALSNWVHNAILESSSSKPQDDCSTDVPKSSGNSNPTATSTNPSDDQMETLTVETPIPTFEDILGVTTNSDESNEVEADVSNMETTIIASPTPTLRIHKDHPKSQIISHVETLIQTKNKSKENVWTLVDCPKEVRPIGTKWVLKNKKDERGIVIKNKARLVAQGHTQEEEIDYDEVFEPVTRIKDPEFPARVYKVEKAMYGLHQAPRAWHQVTPKECHLHAVKTIFRYLKGHPKLGLWYPKESPFDLVAYSDSDYGGATQDHKSTTGGCQFLGRRSISWQCKKQTIVATSTTEAEYVVAASCCGQVLWIQNQLLDYGNNFMNTKIYIDNNSAICKVKNPVYHSKTKHIEIRHHFIKDCFEKKLINVDHIHTDENVADLLTKPFDAGRFQYLVDSVVNLCINSLNGSDSEQRTHEFIHVYLASASVYVWQGKDK